MRMGTQEISVLTQEQHERIRRNRRKIDGVDLVHAAIQRIGGGVCPNNHS